MAKAWKPDALARRIFVIVIVGVVAEIAAMVLLGF
jgi:hypothetical protein